MEKGKYVDSDDEFPEKVTYAYWKRDFVEPKKPEPVPKTEVVVNNENKSEDKTQTGASAWNSAGTWEEKHLTKEQVEEYFNKELDKEKFFLESSFLVEKISDFKGDVFYVFVRGKQKFHYDCEFKIHFQGHFSHKDIKGEILLRDVSNNDDADEFIAEFTQDFKGVDIVRRNKDKVLGLFKEIFGDLKTSLFKENK